MKYAFFSTIILFAIITVARPAQMQRSVTLIRRFRRAQTGGYQRRERLEVLITTFGRDVAVTNIVYRRVATGMIGRETKIMARIPGLGFRVVSAHVSLNEAGTPVRR